LVAADSAVSDRTQEAAKDLETDRTYAEPRRLPEWTGGVVLAWFPVSVLTAATLSSIGGERIALPTLAGLLLGFFVVLGVWITPDSSVRALIKVVVAAITLASVSTAFLAGVAAWGSALGVSDVGTEAGSNGGGHEPGDAALRGEDLTGVDLAGRVISGYDLSDRDMQGARLDGAVAVRSAFVSSWLKGASLRGALLTQADFTGACLADADLRGAELTGAVFEGADLSHAELDPAQADLLEDRYSSTESVTSRACGPSMRPSR